jgi:hypothetical protein
MTAPQVNYVTDTDGNKIFVQLTVSEWENFVAEFERIDHRGHIRRKNSHRIYAQSAHLPTTVNQRTFRARCRP